MLKKLLAECLGTATLVLFGCGSAVLAGSDIVGQLGISFAFGLTIVAMAYGIGPVSGCHVNPAVSFGAYLAGRVAKYIPASALLLASPDWARAEGHEIVSLDRVAPAEGPADPRVHSIVGEVSDYDGLLRAFEGCDALIHMAAIPTPFNAVNFFVSFESQAEVAAAYRSGKLAQTVV